jgi:hypothetical protein
MHLSELLTLGRNFRSVNQEFAREPLIGSNTKIPRGGRNFWYSVYLVAERVFTEVTENFRGGSELPTHTNFAGIKLWSVCSDSSDFLLVLLSTLATPYYISASLLIVR